MTLVAHDSGLEKKLFSNFSTQLTGCENFERAHLPAHQLEVQQNSVLLVVPTFLLLTRGTECETNELNKCAARFFSSLLFLFVSIFCSTRVANKKRLVILHRPVVCSLWWHVTVKLCCSSAGPA